MIDFTYGLRQSLCEQTTKKCETHHLGKLWSKMQMAWY